MPKPPTKTPTLGPNSTTAMGDPTAFPMRLSSITGINESQTSSQVKRAAFGGAAQCVGYSGTGRAQFSQPEKSVQEHAVRRSRCRQTMVPINANAAGHEYGRAEPRRLKKGGRSILVGRRSTKAIAEMEQSAGAG